MGSLAVPFHFISTFVVTIAAGAALWLAVWRRQFAPPGKWARRMFAAGWGLLALAEFIHGSLLAASELEQSVWALRSGAYALLVVSLLPPEGSRKKGKTKAKPKAAALAPTTGTAFMPSFLAISSAVFAFRHPLPLAKRLAVALGAFAASEVLFGLAGDLTGATPGTMWFLAHGSRLAGAVGLATWLWQAIRNSIQVRFVAVFIGLLLVVVVSLSGAMTSVFTQNVSDETLRAAAFGAQDKEEDIAGEVDEAKRRALQVAQPDPTRQAFANRDAALVPSAKRLQSPGGPYETSDFLAFLDPAGAILALSAEGTSGPTMDSADAVSLAGTGVVQTVLESKDEAASLDALGGNKIAIIGAAPVLNPAGFDPPGSPQGLAGVVVVGTFVDESYVRELRVQGDDPVYADQEAFVVARDRVLAGTNADIVGLVESFNQAMQRKVFEEGERYVVEAPIGEQRYIHSFIPLERTDNQVVAALVVSRRSEVLELTQRNVGRVLFLISLLATALAIGLAYLSGSRITRPIRALTLAAEKVTAGELDTKVEVQGSDEVGVLGRTFGDMTVSLARLTNDLRTTAEQLQTILQSMADGVVAVDDQGKVLIINTEAERILGTTSGSAAGKPVADVLALVDALGGDVALPIYDLRQGAASGTTVASGVPVAITSAPITDERGDTVGGVAVLRDMSRELEIEKMKTEFLSNISHELRTPLTSIKGYADILRRRTVPKEKMMGFLDVILESSERLQRIIEMLVDFSSMEAGRFVLRPGTVDLDQTVSDLIAKWQPMAPSHTFMKKGLSKVPVLEVDERMIPLAINELIDNAVKFSPDGGKIVISAEVESANGSGKIRISVSDPGIGISKEDLARIGEDFVQLDPSATRAFGGLGLGLSYVRRIIEGHGGRLEAQSASGRGSKFTLVLPSGALAAPPSAKTTSRRSSSNGRKVASKAKARGKSKKGR